MSENIKISIHLLLAIASLLFVSCEGEFVPDLGAIQLISPSNNEECQQGKLIGNDSINVQFVFNDNQAYDRYELNLVDGNSVQFVSEIKSGDSIGVKLGATYKWFISGFNQEGSGKSSEYSFRTTNAVIQTKAPFPAFIQLQKSSNESLLVNWHSPSDIFDGNISYSVRLLGENGQSIVLATQTNSTSMTINDLLPFNDYKIEVEATGLQSNSAISIESFNLSAL